MKKTRVNPIQPDDLKLRYKQKWTGALKQSRGLPLNHNQTTIVKLKQTCRGLPKNHNETVIMALEQPRHRIALNHNQKLLQADLAS